MRRLRDVPIFVKLGVLALVAVIGVLTVGAAHLASVQPAELDARKAKVQSLVESARSVIDGFYQRADKGELTTTEAQAAAIAAIKTMRYGDGDYFWINDLGPAMIMHPMKPELDGKDLSGSADPNGTLLFVEFVKVVKKDGAGFVEYQWPKPDHDEPVDKLSYVAGFEPWGWVIGTGIYIDDVQATVAAKRRTVMTQTGVAVILVAFVLVLVSMSITRPLRRVTAATRRLADGDFDLVLPPPGRNEIGRMTGALRVLRDNLVDNRALAEENDRLRTRSEADRQRTTEELADQLGHTVNAVVNRLNEAVSAMQTGAADLGAATDGLVGTVHEISRLAQDSTAAAGQAAAETSTASGTVSGLTSAADTIGGVVEVIRQVAAQTNLLALNATIEAARAGDVGKGFAVVANEVKELAQQSSRATDDIAREIEAIQATSQGAAQVIDRMSATVRSLGASTHEVAVAISGDEAGVEALSVRRSAEETGRVAHRIDQLSGDLAAEAERLRRELSELLDKLRQPA